MVTTRASTALDHATTPVDISWDFEWVHNILCLISKLLLIFHLMLSVSYTFFHQFLLLYFWQPSAGRDRSVYKLLPALGSLPAV